MEVDVDQNSDELAVVAEGDDLLNVGVKLELVLEVLGCEQRAVGEPVRRSAAS